MTILNLNLLQETFLHFKMAKSIRSKSKRKARDLKRKTIFGEAEKERLGRLVEKQLAATVEPLDAEPVAETKEMIVDTKVKRDSLLNRNQMKKKSRAKAKGKLQKK
jgi:hypothetical protein